MFANMFKRIKILQKVSSLLRNIACIYTSIAIIMMLSGCGNEQPVNDTISNSTYGSIHSNALDDTAIQSYSEIPNISQATIDAVEAIKEQRKSENKGFVFGAVSNVEGFYTHSNTIEGYNAILCSRLSKLFDIPFEIEIYTHEQLTKGLDSLDIDFTNAFVSNEYTKQTYITTEGIAQRVLKVYHLQDTSLPKAVKLGFVTDGELEFSMLSKDAISPLLDKQFESVEIVSSPDYETAYRMMEAGEADAFLDVAVAENFFSSHKNVISYDFFPLVYENIAFATKNPQLAPIIAAIEAYISSPNVDSELRFMHDKGNNQYLSQKLMDRLDDESKIKLLSLQSEGLPLKVGIEYDNFPITFYNTKENAWQGIAVDTLKRISEITGISFVAANKPGINWSDLIDGFNNGDIPIMAELLQAPDREGKYLWTQVPYCSDYYALISTDDYPIIEFKHVPNLRVGLIKGYANADIFRELFPDHKYIHEYESVMDAFDNLEKGDVDLLMASNNLLLSMLNYSERLGFKDNKMFDYHSDSYFGFPLQEDLLLDIINEAQLMVNTEQISDNWTHAVFDYSTQMAKMQMRYILFGSILIILLIILFIYTHVKKERKYSKNLEDFNANLQSMVAEQTAKVMELQNSILITIADLVESRDGDTGGHVERTQKYLEILVAELKNRGVYKDEIETWDLQLLIQSSQLHDVGKISISDTILKKPGKLTFEEFDEMKQHTTLGGAIIDKIKETTSGGNFLNYAKIFAMTHHEKWDGTGYPNKLAGDDIPLQGRIMAFADVYDALTSVRPYKVPFSHEKALQIIKEGYGTQFDPTITDVFLVIHKKFEIVRGQIYH
ncbi:transporter substrate-binding domain-containing protein [Lachnospiraceae bacterium ZAX-1]